MRTHTLQFRNDDGAEIAEAALVLPVVFIFLLGIVWFGRAFNIYSTIQQAAQQGAIVAARPTCATCSTPNQFPLAATVATSVTNVMQASSLDPTQIITPGTTPTGCTNSSNIIICQRVLLNAAPPVSTPTSCSFPPTPTQICGTLVTFQYPFKFYLPFTSLNLSQVTLTAQAQSRMEN
jgi:Flp pilus assembly protein TadG